MPLKTIFPKKNIGQLSSDEVETWVSGIVKKEASKYDASIVREALFLLRMPLNITDRNSIMTDFCNECVL